MHTNQFAQGKETKSYPRDYYPGQNRMYKHIAIPTKESSATNARFIYMCVFVCICMLIILYFLKIMIYILLCYKCQPKNQFFKPYLKLKAPHSGFLKPRLNTILESRMACQDSQNCSKKKKVGDLELPKSKRIKCASNQSFPSRGIFDKLIV